MVINGSVCVRGCGSTGGDGVDDGMDDGGSVARGVMVFLGLMVAQWCWLLVVVLLLALMAVLMLMLMMEVVLMLMMFLRDDCNCELVV